MDAPPSYRATDYPPFAVTVDLVVLTVRARQLCVLLVRRGEAPHAGCLALPGGFVRPEESLRAAAERELAEETGVAGLDAHLEQLASYGDPKRDPRMRVVSVAWLALAADLPDPVAGTDAVDAAFVPADAALGEGRLAFDHAAILSDGLDRARAKLEYSALAASFCPPEFTVSDLREVYEAVWGARLDPRNFHRKVTGTDGFLRPTGRRRADGAGRPAELFTADPLATLHPALLRPAPG
ncbi:MAG: NUDIX domain-containing protein [Kineosporiaceae bacterium]